VVVSVASSGLIHNIGARPYTIQLEGFPYESPLKKNVLLPYCDANDVQASEFNCLGHRVVNAYTAPEIILYFDASVGTSSSDPTLYRHPLTASNNVTKVQIIGYCHQLLSMRGGNFTRLYGI